MEEGHHDGNGSTCAYEMKKYDQPMRRDLLSKISFVVPTCVDGHICCRRDRRAVDIGEQGGKRSKEDVRCMHFRRHGDELENKNISNNFWRLCCFICLRYRSCPRSTERKGNSHLVYSGLRLMAYLPVKTTTRFCKTLKTILEWWTVRWAVRYDL